MNYEGITMEDILNLSFRWGGDEPKTTIDAKAKKVVLVRQYESETLECSSSMEVAGNLTGLERACLAEILHCSLEFSIYTQCLTRGLIQKAEFDNRKMQMKNSVLTLINKLNTINPESDILAQIIEQLN